MASNRTQEVGRAPTVQRFIARDGQKAHITHKCRTVIALPVNVKLWRPQQYKQLPLIQEVLNNFSFQNDGLKIGLIISYLKTQIFKRLSSGSSFSHGYTCICRAEPR